MKNKIFFFNQHGHRNFEIVYKQPSRKYFVTKRLLRIRKHCTKN